MIDSFIRGILGPLGSRVLDFYIANGLWINGLLLLYALLVVLARRTFDLGRQFLVETIQKEYGPQIEHQKSESILKVLRNISIPWERAIGSSPFPLITPPGSMLVYPKNLATFQRLVPPEKIAELLVKQ
jgi:hypothetical protein